MEQSPLTQPSSDSLPGLDHLVLELVGSHLVLEMVLTLAKGDLHVLGAWAYWVVVVFHMTHFQYAHMSSGWTFLLFNIFIAILLSLWVATVLKDLTTFVKYIWTPLSSVCVVIVTCDVIFFGHFLQVYIYLFYNHSGC